MRSTKLGKKATSELKRFAHSINKVNNKYLTLTMLRLPQKKMEVNRTGMKHTSDGYMLNKM